MANHNPSIPAGTAVLDIDKSMGQDIIGPDLYSRPITEFNSKYFRYGDFRVLSIERETRRGYELTCETAYPACKRFIVPFNTNYEYPPERLVNRKLRIEFIETGPDGVPTEPRAVHISRQQGESILGRPRCVRPVATEKAELPKVASPGPPGPLAATQK